MAAFQRCSCNLRAVFGALRPIAGACCGAEGGIWGPASFISPRSHILDMPQSTDCLTVNLPRVDIDRLAGRLDRMDILLLRQFYVTGRPYPNDTTSHVLRLLAERFRTRMTAYRRAPSYGAIRHRLENLRALGLIGKIARTNPAVYVPLDPIAVEVRRLIVRFAAELVGADTALRG